MANHEPPNEQSGEIGREVDTVPIQGNSNKRNISPLRAAITAGILAAAALAPGTVAARKPQGNEGRKNVATEVQGHGYSFSGLKRLFKLFNKFDGHENPSIPMNYRPGKGSGELRCTVAMRNGEIVITDDQGAVLEVDGAAQETLLRGAYNALKLEEPALLAAKKSYDDFVKTQGGHHAKK